MKNVPVAGRMYWVQQIDAAEPLASAFERGEEALARALLDQSVVGVESLLAHEVDVEYEIDGTPMTFVRISIPYFDWPAQEWDGRSTLEAAMEKHKVSWDDL